MTATCRPVGVAHFSRREWVINLFTHINLFVYSFGSLCTHFLFIPWSWLWLLFLTHFISRSALLSVSVPLCQCGVRSGGWCGSAYRPATTPWPSRPRPRPAASSSVWMISCRPREPAQQVNRERGREGARERGRARRGRRRDREEEGGREWERESEREREEGERAKEGGRVGGWSYGMMLLHDVTVWCYGMMLLYDVTVWCYGMMVWYDVTVWCYGMMLLHDVTAWCYGMMLRYDVTVWCYGMMLWSLTVEWVRAGCWVEGPGSPIQMIILGTLVCH